MWGSRDRGIRGLQKAGSEGHGQRSLGIYVTHRINYSVLTLMQNFALTHPRTPCSPNVYMNGDRGTTGVIRQSHKGDTGMLVRVGLRGGVKVMVTNLV